MPETPTAPAEPDHAASTLAGQYMTFDLAGESYGIEILSVRELIGLLPIRRVPRAPGHVRGVVDLRGRVVPIVDLRVRFGMPPAEPTDQSVIVVVQCAAAGGPLTAGVLVDRVLEVLAFEAAAIEPPPALAGASGATIRGVAKTGQRVVFLLDAAGVLSAAAAPAAA